MEYSAKTMCKPHDELPLEDKIYLSKSASQVVNASLEDVIACMNKKR
ncbi:hypothetical protein ACFLY2_01450 [Patescibacteria group bacterium]